MRICYLILLFDKFDQAVRMVQRLSGPDISFIIHVDAKADTEALNKFKQNLEPFGSVFYAARERSKWGSFKLVQATLNCIRAAVLQAGSFDRCILISGQDYPIASNSFIKQFFREKEDVEFIEAVPLNLADVNAPGWSPYYRFRRHHFWIDNRRITVPFLTKRCPDFPVFHGSTWWALSKEAIEYLFVEAQQKKPINSFFKTGFLVEEAYIPTLMMNSPFAHRITGHDITLAKWTPDSGPHPKIFTSADLETLLASSKLFARKFDANLDSNILDMLDGVHAMPSGETCSPV